MPTNYFVYIFFVCKMIVGFLFVYVEILIDLFVVIQVLN